MPDELRSECFHIDRSGALVRSVTPARGRPYLHRCERRIFEDLAYTIEEHAETGVTIEDLSQWAKVPLTQTAVALAFLKERSCLITEGRRSFPAGVPLYEDAMLEYWALADRGEVET